MLAEYKKENTSKELQRLADDVNRKKKQAKTYESQAKSRLEELKQFDSIGFTKEEVGINFTPYENLPMQYIENFFKSKNFIGKNLIFLIILLKTLIVGTR